MGNSDESIITNSLDGGVDAAPKAVQANTKNSIIIDLALGGVSDDFDFILSITTTLIAQLDFADGISCSLSCKDFTDSLWRTESCCTRISASFARFLGHGSTVNLANQPLQAIFPDSQDNRALIAKWFTNNFSAEPIRLASNDSTTPRSCVEYSFHRKLVGDNLKKLWIVARDISPLYRDIQKLTNAEQHYRTLVERPGIVLSRSSPDGDLLYISPLVEKFIGHNAQELIENPTLISQLIHPDDSVNYYGLLQARANQKPTAMDAEFRVRYKDGTYRWIYERQHPKLDADGQVEYYDSIILDINEKKQLEQQLLHAQRMETLGLSVGGIAHDFNNYLAAISGQIELAIEELKATIPDQTQQPFTHLTLAQQALLNCAAMSKRLLSFSRKTETARNSVNLYDLLTETAKLLGYSMPDTVSIELHDIPKKLSVLGNKVELQQLLVNLGLNSRDAIDGNGIIQFSANQRNGQARIKVKDSGRGIPANQLAHIFDPYFTTKAHSGGSGLGLSLAYSIAQAHGGDLHVRSDVGVGTEICLSLPVAASDSNSVAKTEGPSIARGNETILVVEDDTLILSMVKSALASYGYTALVASSAAQATEQFLQHREKINLVILDYSMQGASGDSVVAEIFNCDESFPILLTSGYGENLFNVPVNARFVDFIAKPYPIAELMQAVRSLLDRKK